MEAEPTSNLACFWVAKETVELREHAISTLGDEDVRVKVISTGICGSDYHNWKSDKIKKPLVMGHESAGEITQIGSEVKDRSIGQRVAIEPGFACMKCEFCLRGNPNTCANLKYCGLEPTPGTLCRYFVCPSWMTIPISQDISWKEAGCIQPLAIAVQLGRRANMRAHQTVAIFGCGPLGLLIMAVAKAYGVKRTIVFDIEQSRVEFAKRYYADVGIVCPLNKDSQEPLNFATDFVQDVVKQEGLGFGVDLAIEASGADTCMQMAVVMTKPGGTIIQAGLGTSLSSVPMFLVTAKELNLKGTVRYTPGCFADAIDMLDRKLVNLEPLITSTYPLTRSNEAFKAQNVHNDIKIVVMNQE
ncbi:MAG: hypothetical protein M1834_002088 [Cirrosporium novae-zelandiae]|nr:MAG: hypothetical protein M1834_002088 [Cirrosporium novae-zelandiae]